MKMAQEVKRPSDKSNNPPVSHDEGANHHS